MALLSLLLPACGYIRIVPDNAEAFVAELECGSRPEEVFQLALVHQLHGLSCPPQPDNSALLCQASVAPRVLYKLYFDEQRGLNSLQEGFVYGLMRLSYDEPVPLCQ